MTQDEIISMAHECHVPVDWRVKNLVRFANLVAARERESCAKVCEPQGGMVTVNGRLAGVYGVLAREIAKAIRARGDSNDR